MPSEESKQVIEMIKSRPVLQGTTIEEMRAGLESVLTPVADDVVCTPDAAGGVAVEFIVAPGASETQVLLYLHGGGYALGSIATHRGMCGELSRASGMRVLSVDYRLAPENPFPAAVDDAVAAYQSLIESGYDAGSLAIAGDSAGGGLAAATLVAIRDRGLPLPACAALLSPWTDLAITGDSIAGRADRDPMIGGNTAIRDLAKAYLGDAPATTPLASPLYADLRGLPPLLIQVGSEEVLFDDAARFDVRARDQGVDSTLEEWDGQVHVFQCFFPVLPEGREAIARIGSFVKSHLKVAAAV